MHGMERLQLPLNLPMPVGLAPSLYTARITATSIDDPSVTEQITINVNVVDIGCFYQMKRPIESYIPGGIAQSMRFEVRK